MRKEIQYKFNEEKWINEISEYIRTYYAYQHSINQDSIQTNEQLSDVEMFTPFIIDNIIKYVQRLDRKNDSYAKRKSYLFKVIHYTILCLEQNDRDWLKQTKNHLT